LSSQDLKRGPLFRRPIPDESKAPHQSAGKPEAVKLSVEAEENKGGLPLDKQRSQPIQRSGNILGDLRSGWLADHETGSEEKYRRPAKPGLALQGKLKIILAEWVRLLASIPKAFASMVRKSRDAMGETARGAATGMPGLIALFAVMIVIGAAAYLIAVQHIFDRGNLLDAPRTDLPAVSSRGSSASEQPAALTPQKGGNEANSRLYEWGVRTLNQAAAHSSPPPLPHGEHLANLAGGNGVGRQIATGPPSFDFGSVLDWASFRTARGIAPGANLAQTQRDEQGTRYPALAYAKPLPAAAAPYQAGQSILRTQAPPTVSPVAVPPRAMESGSLFALEVAQVRAANYGNGDIEGTALDAIAHGGNAVFLLQHFDESKGNMHPARLLLTATTLEFLPEGPCEIGAFTIELASITSVKTGQGGAEMAGAGLLNIEFKGRAQPGRLSFHAPSFPLPQVKRLSSHTAVARGSDLLTHIRNVILTVQSGS
jgi:hypothetical protein